MFPYVGVDSGISLTRTDIEAPLLIKAAGWTYSVAEDDSNIGFEVEITDPEGSTRESGWRIYNYTDALLAIFGEISARQRLPGAESNLFSYIEHVYQSEGVAERKVLDHCRSATARLVMVNDMIATAVGAHQSSFDETSQSEINEN
jgi:hypothetical protein